MTPTSLADVHAAPGHRPRRVRRIAISGVVVLLVVVAATYSYRTWWTKPTAFGPVGNEAGITQRPGKTEAVSVEMGASLSEETVILAGARANVVVNTADADITFALCHRTAPFILLNGDQDAHCDKAEPLVGQHLSGTDYEEKTIVMIVTPHHPGRVEVHGMTVDYSRGARHLWQRGEEAAGIVVKLRVK